MGFIKWNWDSLPKKQQKMWVGQQWHSQHRLFSPQEGGNPWGRPASVLRRGGNPWGRPASVLDWQFSQGQQSCRGEGLWLSYKSRLKILARKPLARSTGLVHLGKGFQLRLGMGNGNRTPPFVWQITGL